VKIGLKLAALLAIVFSLGRIGYAAQESRTQYPWWLKNSYIDFGVGYQHYPVSLGHFNTDSRISVRVPPLSVRLTLLGHNFSKSFSAQIMYLRPVKWVVYHEIDGISSARSPTNIAGLTGRWTTPLQGPVSLYWEGGLGVVTRNRASLYGRNLVEEANYPTVLTGLGAKYRLNRVWDIQLGGVYLPPKKKFHQPSTMAVSLGAVFNMRPLSADQVKERMVADRLFPKHLLQFGAATNRFGTGVNRFVSGKTMPIFWGGLAEVEKGYAARYQQNVFHGKKIFALDLGLSVGQWQSIGQKTSFVTFSAFPQFRFVLLRSKPADFYFSYSLAGPTYITKSEINGHQTGKRFTFQDLMGAGLYAGRQKEFNFEVGIGHYSNGNLFPRNAGIKIPLTFSAGYVFW